MNLRLISTCLLLACLALRADDSATNTAAILTPPAPAAPRINGPNIFGVRPGAPFLYTIPATGDRPMTFSVENLPVGLSVDPVTGQITGSLSGRTSTGDKGASRLMGREASTGYVVMLRAKNTLGAAAKKFRIVVGDQIALTPPMGWNSWNCWAGAVDQQKVLQSARALVASGLINHGWTYVNMDDTWQGKRTGKDRALQGNEKFPDLKALCDEIHRMGLRAGIYSTPWITSYAGFPGGSSDNADGAWSKKLANNSGHHHGKYSFTTADANQLAAWGFDYLKYDWDPNDVPHTKEMSQALRHSGRDIVFSLSNTAPFDHAADWARWANCWRTTGDIRDHWVTTNEFWEHGVSEIGFNQDRWAPCGGPGHWNDPDMLVVGDVGWGPSLRPTHLTPDEQYTHISLWCLLSAPLLIGCNLEQLDPFTLGLLSNDEVLAIDQDALGRPAVRAATFGAVDIYVKPLEDGSKAVGFFNRDSVEQKIACSKLIYLGLSGRQHVRDLWRQQDLPDIADTMKNPLPMTIPAHGVQLYKFSPAK